MNTITLNLEDELAALLQGMDQPAPQAIREMVVLELYRRGTISSGKAAQLLKMTRWEFIRYASRLGIAFFDMTTDEWQSEKDLIETL
jgi:predicted HTH domain antitoxin